MESHCISHLKQLTCAISLYAENYDDNLPPVLDERIDRYSKENVSDLKCPAAPQNALGHSAFRKAGYIYEYESFLVLRSLITSKDLGQGRFAPLYDQDNDALLKCGFHFDGGYAPSGALRVQSEQTIAHKSLTAYRDTSVRYSPQVPCWQIPTLPVALREAAIAHCDGKIIAKK